MVQACWSVQSSRPGYSGCPGDWGRRGGRPAWKGVTSQSPSQSCQAWAGLFAYYFAFICMPLSGRGPHSSAAAPPSFPESLHRTPHSQMKRPSAGLAGGTGRDQEVAAGLHVKAAGGPFGGRKCFLSSNFHSLTPLLLHLCPVLCPLPLNFMLRPLGTFTALT